MSEITNFVDDLCMIRIILLLLSVTLCASIARADFSCTSEVRYRWIPDKAPVVGAKPVATPKAATEGKKEDSADNEESVATEVFWGTIEATGQDEAVAKVKLTEALNKERAKADSACRESHENQTKCIAGKYSQNAAVLSMMSFVQRREIEKTIISDCTNSTGRCVGSSASEASCRELKAKGAEEAPPAEEKKGKEAKKK